MNMHTFSIKAASVVNSIEESVLGKAIDSVKPGVSHVIGALSGATGVATLTKLTTHIQPILAAIATVVAIVGGCFYALYWCYKMLRERKAWKTGVPLKPRGPSA